jgi:hypothetical protein
MDILRLHKEGKAKLESPPHPPMLFGYDSLKGGSLKGFGEEEFKSGEGGRREAGGRGKGKA